jgi:hypothetical protein
MNEKANPNQEPNYFQNWVTAVGQILAAGSFGAILFLFIIDFVQRRGNPYLGIITYLIAPVFLIFSLLLIPIGAWLERRARRKRGYASRFPIFDFNNPVHQRRTLMTLGVLTIFALFTAYGTYRAYEFSESVTFCGQTCHNVMKPEYTAYHNASHARVKCAECHIGEGADWFVRSKLSGTYQVYATLVKNYPKPIPTPIKNLRPAPETCERCHWPQHFYGSIEQDHHYYLSDEKNSPWNTKMMVMIGGGDSTHGKAEGIHWHMNIANEISYVASDEKRQDIPWVKKAGPDGKEEIFVSEDSKYSAAHPPQGELRRMDCIDCHNRASHVFNNPVRAVDSALYVGALDTSLPYIKREAVKILEAKYPDTETALKTIQEKIENFYKEKYPDLVTSKKESINRSIQAIQTIYKNNMFPEMNSSWKAYPDHIGHMNSAGCFRCHDGKHKSVEGTVIRNECNLCHKIVSQGVPGALENNVEGLEFKHPEDMGDTWKEMSCFNCHSGGSV